TRPARGTDPPPPLSRRTLPAPPERRTGEPHRTRSARIATTSPWSSSGQYPTWSALAARHCKAYASRSLRLACIRHRRRAFVHLPGRAGGLTRFRVARTFLRYCRGLPDPPARRRPRAVLLAPRSPLRFRTG